MIENNNFNKNIKGNKNNNEFISNISTGVDSLLDLLKEKKSLSLEEAAKILNVDESIVESWAKFLEESGDVSINYNLLTPYISLNEQKSIVKKDSVLKEKFSDISSKIEFLYDKALNFLKLKDYNSLNDSLKILSKEFNETFNNIQDNLSKEEKDEFERELSNFNSKINTAWNLYKKNNTVKSKIEYENALQQFYLLSEKLKDYLKELSKIKSPSKIDDSLSPSVFSSYESLVEEAKKLLEKGEVEKAKEVYEQLKKLYHEELPKQFELQRESLKKNLFTLSKDLTFALDYEQKNRFEKGKKEILDLLKKVLDSLKNNDFDTSNMYMKYIMNIFNKLPPGFEEEKKVLQEKIVNLNLKIANYKKKLLDEALSEELKEIESLRKKFDVAIKNKNVEEAKTIYSLLKKRYLLLPSDILPEKIDVHIKILDDFKKLSLLQKNIFLEENKNKIEECKNIIKNINVLIEKNDIDKAEEEYSVLQNKIQEISDYFFEDKALLQNDSLIVYKKILDKSKDYYKESFEKSYNDIISFIEQGKKFVDKNNLELAEESYVKALKLYSNLKPVFVDKKKELKDKLFELYKKIVLAKDLNIIEEKSFSIHENYNKLLNLIVDAHHKISSNHLDIFPNIVDEILVLKNSLPKNILEKNKSILEEIKTLEEEKNIYLSAKKIDDSLLYNKIDEKQIDVFINTLSKYKKFLESLNENNNLLDYILEVINKLQYFKQKTIDSFVTIKHKNKKLNKKLNKNLNKKLEEKLGEESNKNVNVDFEKINSRIKKIKSILKSN